VRSGRLPESSAGHRKRFVGHQPVGAHARPVAAAVADRRIDIAVLEIDEGGRSGDTHIKAGMRFLEGGQPRQQPFGGERGEGGDRQHIVVALAQQAVGRKAQVIEGGADAGQVVPRLRCQRQCAVLADEQANAQFLLQPADLMADRGLRDIQFARREREAQMPRRGLECPQTIERRQSGGHSRFPQCMTLFHPKRYKVSFVEGSRSADISVER
jgi:hypothetical protein